MRKLIGNILLAIGILLAIAVAVMNPDKTDMRLFLDHMLEYLISTVLIVVGYILNYGGSIQ